ncbi:hypothetical protein NHH03_05350 [Stieleria sp. TO1_6]|uniref:hypothetical protein n=1 Tax=Stieleria tagensis TaxID=2956795 RepID=UPI00209ABEED|nr:hypothetical protein [Stieleria tagensis]MCO8121154.1 hypothetical protein [Stieleria tagensis]
MSIKTIFQAGLLAAAAMCLLAPEFATAGHGKILDQTGCACCPVCDHVCKLDAKKVDEEKVCFDVESKVICIPRVVFPWQKTRKAACASCDSCAGKGCTACVHNGARVRKVCVLKTDKYTCPVCTYTWSAEKKDGCGGGNCSGGPACDGGCVCDLGCDVGYGVANTPAANVPTSNVASRVALPVTQRTTDDAMTADDYYRLGSDPPATPVMPPTPIRY